MKGKPVNPSYHAFWNRKPWRPEFLLPRVTNDGIEVGFRVEALMSAVEDKDKHDTLTLNEAAVLYGMVSTIEVVDEILHNLMTQPGGLPHDPAE